MKVTLFAELETADKKRVYAKRTFESTDYWEPVTPADIDIDGMPLRTVEVHLYNNATRKMVKMNVTTTSVVNLSDVYG